MNPFTPFASELDIYYNTHFIESFGLEVVQLIDREMFRPLLQQTLDEIRLDIISWNISYDCQLIWSPQTPRGG